MSGFTHTDFIHTFNVEYFSIREGEASVTWLLRPIMHQRPNMNVAMSRVSDTGRVSLDKSVNVAKDLKI